MLWFQFIVNGIIAGAIISLVASGFSLVYATNRFAHFAHGTVVTIAAYFLYTLFTLMKLPFVVAVMISVCLTGLLGVALFRGVYTPLKKRNASNAVLLIASIGLMIFLENVPLLIFGPSVQSLQLIRAQKGIAFLGASVTPLQILIIAVSVVLLIVVWLFVRYAKAGRLMRAVSDNPELSLISGINVQRVQMMSFFVASLMAGVAGVLIALEQNISPLMGTNLIVQGFTASVIGGVMSLPGAVLGSYLSGLVQNIGIVWLPSGYKEAIAFALLLLFLLIKPEGILGVKRGIR